MITPIFKMSKLFSFLFLIALIQSMQGIANSVPVGETTNPETNDSDASNSDDSSQGSNSDNDSPDTSDPDESTNTSKTFKHIKFSDDWSLKYPQCSRLKNKYSSPININTKASIEVGKYLRTLFFYAFEPIKSYTLQTWYSDTENRVTMCALTITLDEKIYLEGAYIRGLGFEDFMLFRKAVFFFSKTKLRPGQSHHRLSGRTYPMEIMLTFNEKKPDTQTVKNTTQIFVLVKIQEHDNPNFFPVIEAAQKILKMMSRKDMIQNLTAKLETYKADLANATEAYKKSGKGGEVKKIKPMIPQIESSASKLAINEVYRKGLKKLRNMTETELKNKKYKEEYTKVVGIYKKDEKNHTNIEKEIDSNPEDVDLADQNVVVEDKLLDDRRLAFALTRVLGSLYHEISRIDNMLTILEKEDAELQAVIDKVSGDIEGDEKPVNGTMLVQFYHNQVKLEAQMLELEAIVNATEAELESVKKSLGWKQPIGPFQVTWLLPDRGGQYTYNGSNPLPPCERRRYSVVLEDTVGISQAQFDILASIPAHEDSDQVADKVTPELGDLGPRLIWHNAKAIQWLRDDGVHMKSIVRRRLKTKKEKGK